MHIKSSVGSHRIRYAVGGRVKNENVKVSLIRGGIRPHFLFLDIKHKPKTLEILYQPLKVEILLAFSLCG